MADTNASAGATTLTTEQCNSFGSKCQTTAKDATAGCLGSWSFRCYPGVGVADSVANYPTGICARCLCNDNKALIADLPCVTLPAVATNSLPSSPGGVQGGGAGGVSSSPAPASPSAPSPEKTAPATVNDGGNGITETSGAGNNTKSPIIDQQSPSQSSSNSYAMPLYITLTLLAVLSASVAVYFYMKRKNSTGIGRKNSIDGSRIGMMAHKLRARNDSKNVGDDLDAEEGGQSRGEKGPPTPSTPSPPPLNTNEFEVANRHNNLKGSLGRTKGAFLRSIWTTTTTTTTKPGKDETTTTVTVSGAFPAKPTITPSKVDVASATLVVTKSPMHTPYLPSDSFLTPASSYGANPSSGAQQNPNWTLEEQWQWDQYQAAVQWHQWQLKQKEWQKQQREYYLAREEERKRTALEATPTPEPARATKRGTLNVAGLKPDPKPSPLRFVVNNDTESLLSRNSSFKRGSGASFVDFASSTANTGRRVSFDLQSVLAGPGDAGLAGSLSRSSTVRSKSVRSAGARSSIVVATSPEWSAPTDLVRVGGGGRRETISSRIEKLRDSGELPGVSAGLNGEGCVSTVLTSSTFALDGDVSVLTLTSVGEDGKPVTTQILSTASSAGGSYDEGMGLPGPRVPSLNGSLLEGGGSMFSDPEDGLVDNVDILEDDLQVKYNVVKAHVPTKEDELQLGVGDQVVVWQILEDGSCEGYNVCSRERGYFPVKSILG